MKPRAYLVVFFGASESGYDEAVFRTRTEAETFIEGWERVLSRRGNEEWKIVPLVPAEET